MTKAPSVELGMMDDLVSLLQSARYAMEMLPEVTRQRDEWKDKYLEELNHSIKHSETVTANMLKLVIGGHLEPKVKS